MGLGWFDARSSKAQGAALASAFAAKIPVGTTLDDKTFARKSESALRQIERDIAKYKAEHRLNMYQKAQLGNAFKWALKEAGYDEHYVGELTEWLMTRL